MDDKRDIGAEFRAFSRLIIEGTRDATTIVEDVHHQIAGGPAILGRPLLPVVQLTSGLVYASIRSVTQLVGAGLDVALEQLEPLLSKTTPPAEYEIVRAALNGVVGDHLARQDNPLAIKMQMRAMTGPLALTPEELAAQFPHASPRVLVFVHGSAMDEALLTRNGHNHAVALAEEFGFTPLFLRYNSGLHISTNGREFAALLQSVSDRWPVPVESVVLIGFSMGGLVSRSAIDIAEEEKLPWRENLKAMFSIGTPHQGAPLERQGNLLESLLGLSRYSIPLKKAARLRSAGITDLRYGSVRDEDWQGINTFELRADSRTPCPLPDVPCFAVAGTTALDAATVTVFGDGLVPVSSALGKHVRQELDLAIPEKRCLVVAQTSHLDLLSSQQVYAQLRDWFSGLLEAR